MRSDNGETWREHTLEATEDAVQEVLQESFDADGNQMQLQISQIYTNHMFSIISIARVFNINFKLIF